MTDIEPTEISQDKSKEDPVEQTGPSITNSKLLEGESQEGNSAQSGAEKTASITTIVEQQTDYFLPRVNSTFIDDLLQCVSEFKVTKESLTNSKTWHTVHEIVITRM
eukprot:TCONS_00018489-protein